MSWLFRRKLQVETAKNIGEQKGISRPEAYVWREEIPHPDNLSEFAKFYRENAVVYAAINSLANMIVGVGFFTEAEDQKAKELVDAYAETVGLDQILIQTCKSMLIYGYAPVERYWQNSLLMLKPLPPETVYVRMDRKGEVLGYRQKVFGSTVDFALEEIVWFCHNIMPGMPYGVGLIQPIYTLLKYKSKILEDICKIVHRYASPLNIWVTRADVSSLKQAVENRQPDEDIFIGRAAPEDVNVKTLEMDPRGRYVDYLEIINQEIYEGLQAPLLTYLRNATEASARTQLESIQRTVDGIQRYIKRVVEKEVFSLVVEKKGLKEVPRIRWGKPTTGVENLTFRDVAMLVQAYVLTSRQAVDLLRKMGLPIEGSEPESVKTEENVKPERRWRVEVLP